MPQFYKDISIIMIYELSFIHFFFLFLLFMQSVFFAHQTMFFKLQALGGVGRVALGMNVT